MSLDQRVALLETAVAELQVLVNETPEQRCNREDRARQAELARTAPAREAEHKAATIASLTRRREGLQSWRDLLIECRTETTDRQLAVTAQLAVPCSRRDESLLGQEQQVLVETLRDIEDGYSHASGSDRLTEFLKRKGITPFPGCPTVFDHRPRGLHATLRQLAEVERALAALV